MEHFHVYIDRPDTRIITDHSALLWLFSKGLNSDKKRHPILDRWVLRLQRYRFSIEHRPGKLHANADAMTRAPIYEDPTSNNIGKEVVTGYINTIPMEDNEERPGDEKGKLETSKRIQKQQKVTSKIENVI